MGASLNAHGELLSLPKGGGAMRGIGEQFSPNLQTGTGNFSVPITVPAGRNGFQPRIELQYSTGRGNGVFGLGWSLDVPQLSRKTSKGLPRYQDAHPDSREHDTFVLSGAEDLVLLGDPSAPVGSYRPRTEGLFAQIERHRDAGNDYWVVRSKEGLQCLYGTPRPANAVAAWSDPAVVARPPIDGARQVFSWLPTLTTDPFGNRIEYLYDERDQSTAAEIREGHQTRDQPLLSEIRYADYEAAGATRFLVTVRFEYGARPDAYSEYRAGFELRSTRRCKAILIETHADQDRKVRRYEIDYDNTALNGVSHLVAIRLLGYDDAGVAVQEMPPVEFSYTGFEPQDPGRRTFSPITGRDLPSFSLADPSLELVDLFGRGLPDILQLNGVPRYWRNAGRGRFEQPRTMSEAPDSFVLADAGVQIIDADGDGRADLLVTRPGLSGYFPLEFGARWDRRSFHPYASAPSIDLKSADVRLVDLTGDGVTDVIRAGSSLECFFNDSQLGWQRTRQLKRQSLQDFPDVDFVDTRVKFADISGDGLSDIVYVHDGNLSYWPNLGYGAWGRRITMRNSPRLPYDYDPARVLIGDVNGDGLADLIYVDDRKIFLWINQSGNAWSDRIVIEGTAPVSNMDSVRLTDLLGTGVAGVLWSGDALPFGQASSFFLDLTGGIKPHLLREMNNNMGARTRVAYTPSTVFYLEDQRTPETRWKTTLPFPVQVISQVESIDGLSGGKLTTEYRYHHGYWDGDEREFRGFGLVEQFDSERLTDYSKPGLHGDDTAFAAVDYQYFTAPTRTRTWFHVGPVSQERSEWHELEWSDEYWSGDAPLLAHTESVDAFLRTLPDRRTRRDALRALRGRVLRTELYALDGTDREGRPYTVTEHAYGLREEAPPVAGSDRSRIFFPHELAQRSTQWERGDDPLTRSSYASDYDTFGNALTRIDVACPRGWRRIDDSPANVSYLATVTRTQLAASQDATIYIHDRPARVASYEILNPATAAGRTLTQILALALSPPDLRLFSETLNFYDSDPTVADRLEFQGLPFGVLGRYGTIVRSETLALTDDVLSAAYGTARPAYFTPGQALAANADYPAGFIQQFHALAGYVFHAAGAGSPYAGGYYVTTQSKLFDFHRAGVARGLVLAQRDPLGAETAIEYDQPYHVLPTSVTNAANLTARASYDYRVFQPRLLTEPNDNRTRIDFTPAGLVRALWVLGKANQAEGDVARASTIFEYDFLAFLNSTQIDPTAPEPVFVRTLRYTHHDSDVDDHGDSIETREYSDGFGRLLQSRIQAEDVRFGNGIFGGGEAVLPAAQDDGRGEDLLGVTVLANVTVSGAQRFDNKGRVVERHEPYYSTGWSYAPPRADTDPHARDFGARIATFHDPMGRIIRVLHADGSEHRVLFGVPANLDDPTNADQLAPSAWEAYTYDANDNAGRTHAATSAGYRHHWNTPTSIVMDALGRTVLSIARNRAKPAPVADPLPPIEEHRTRISYDIQGHPLLLTDSLNRPAFTYVYDLGGHMLRTTSIDAGERRIVLDAAGQEIERQDGNGGRTLRSYDALNRPSRTWARNVSGEGMTLRTRAQYGDAGDPNQPPIERLAARAANSLGKLSQQQDEAGQLLFNAYDFKSNLLDKARSVVASAELVAALDAASGSARRFAADWDDPPALEGSYQVSNTYDALNRLKSTQYPGDVSGARKTLTPSYNHAGLLERVAVDSDLFVERIAYNAKSQRVLIAYGNNVMTRYAYHPQTFRLTRMRTERFGSTAALSYQPQGQPLQDVAHAYDLAGNLTRITEQTPGCGVRNNAEALLFQDLAIPLAAGDALVRRFEYDPRYRLLSATGREANSIPQGGRPWEDLTRDGFNWGAPGTPTPDTARDSTRTYTETYEYDAADNMLATRHGTWTRYFGTSGQSNRLTHVGDQAGVAQTHFFDDSGNLIRENTERHLAWDATGRLAGFANRTGAGAASVEACYLYDSAGQRVRKLVRRGANVESTVYIDGMFEHRVSGTDENNTLHILDGRKRIAMLRVGAPLQGDTGPTVQYQLGDHLESVIVVIGGADASAAGFVNREEFFPYGETSFGSFGRKRYRFTGQERDEESGLAHHGARYYAPYLARWTATDPMAPADGLNAYTYCHDSPCASRDPAGRQAEAAKVDDVDENWQYPASLGSWSAGEPQKSSKPAATSTPPLVESGPSLEVVKESEETGRHHEKPLFEGTIPSDDPKWEFMEVLTSVEEAERENAWVPQSLRDLLPTPTEYYTTKKVYAPLASDAPTRESQREEETPATSDAPSPIFEQPNPDPDAAVQPTIAPGRSLVLGKPNFDFIGLAVVPIASWTVGLFASAAIAPNLVLALLPFLIGVPIPYNSFSVPMLVPVSIAISFAAAQLFVLTGLHFESNDAKE